ncbi:MAG: hypothetical protein M3Q55_15185 [Acidobacteriota bacterium]|nr:hypothetical protein [Acidobacteriota bacterium]
MFVRKLVVVFIALIVLSVAGSAIVSVAAQKKGGGPTYVLAPVSADFRCPLASDCATAARIDRIGGDGLGPYNGTAGKNDGAYFNSNYNLYFHLSPAYGRSVNLDFSDQAVAAPCATQGGCRKNFSMVQTFSSDPPSLTNVLDDTGVSLPNGFLDIAVGESTRARFLFNFLDPAGRALRWTIRFNAEFYPGSTDLTVTRTGVNTWEVEASVDDIAELVAVPTKGKAVMTHEGFYTMPFKMTVTR